VEIGACRNLYSEPSAVSRVKALLHRFEMRSKVAIADDAATALALTHFPVDSRLKLPVSSLIFYANPFGKELIPSALAELDNTVRTLKRLGLNTLGDFLKLPAGSLASRFGKTAVLAKNSVEFAQNVPWPQFHPNEKILIQEDLESLHAPTEMEHIIFLLKKTCDKAAALLKARGKLAVSIEFRIVQHPYSTVKNPIRKCQIELTFPQGSALSLLGFIKEHLTYVLQKEPLEAPIDCIELEVTHTAPSRSSQRNFFSNSEEELESFRSLVSRLIDRLGLENVFKAEPLESFLPEKAWKKTLEEPKDITPVGPIHPLRLLPTPIPLRKLDRILASPQSQWETRSMTHSHRIHSEWWNGSDERDYFRVKTECNQELWIYWSKTQERLFLQGVFD
jgi:protein ImuB